MQTRKLVVAMGWVLLLPGCRGCRDPEASPVPQPSESVDVVTEASAAVSVALDRRESEGELRAPTLSLDVPFDDPPDDPALVDDYFDAAESDGAEAAEPVARPELAALPGDRSFSIGPPNGGWLMNGKALVERGPNHRVLRGTVERKWHFGGDGLLRLLQEAAAHVSAERPGSVLRVGNLSRQTGGKITPSVSHQSGRDVDVGLYCTDLDGNPVDPAGFPKFDGSRGAPDVDTSGQYVFDVARNWLFVEALLLDGRARVQWVFLDTPLKGLILEWAIRNERDSKLIDRAEKLIVRPKNSSPHANHFHVRVFCNAGDLDTGCKDYGPEWQWVKDARVADDHAIDGLIDRIMKGEKGLLDLDGGAPPAAREASPKDPPTDVDLRL